MRFHVNRLRKPVLFHRNSLLAVSLHKRILVFTGCKSFAARSCKIVSLAAVKMHGCLNHRCLIRHVYIFYDELI